MNLLEISDLRIDFGREAKPLTAVDAVSLSIGPGEVVGLVGESGSGKSLTSRAALRLVPHPGRVSGRVSFDGRDIYEMTNRELREFRAHDVGMIFQDPFSSLNPVFRVGAQLTETLRANRGLSRAAAKSEAIGLLESVGIPEPGRRYKSYPHELSGGMRQRVMIALATASRPRLLLADEPTTALDVTTQKQILALLSEMQRQSEMSILLVSHDFGVIAQMCDRVAVMYGGRVVETGPVGRIYDSPQHPYTKALLACVPAIDRFDRAGAPVPLAGQPPELGATREGCVFAPRCPVARRECTTERMHLEPVGTGHETACPYEISLERPQERGQAGWTRR